MTRIRVETFVRAPVERVFDLARDIDFHVRSLAHTGEEAVGGRTTGLIEKDEEVEWRGRHLGVTWRMRSRVTQMDRPASFTDAQVRGPFASFEHRHAFEPRDGGTLMTDQWTHAAPLGPLGWIVDRLFLARHMRRLLAERAEAIRREAESGLRNDEPATSPGPSLKPEA